ncbi:MAG: hypothetical protein NT015_07890 [Alphaproteobacteria bacterium]|nr:hypothetical protein [Alphaproteobacteria bacterium]
MREPNGAEPKPALPVLELGLLLVAIAACVWTWDRGGILGLIGCFCGAALSFNGRSVLHGAFAGLWVGVILGGLFGSAVERLLG